MEVSKKVSEYKSEINYGSVEVRPTKQLDNKATQGLQALTSNNHQLHFPTSPHLVSVSSPVSDT